MVMDITLLISFLIFSVFMLLGGGIFYSLNYRKKRKELVARVKHIERESTIEETKNLSLFDKAKKYLLNIISSLGDSVKPKNQDELSHIRRMFARAGYRQQNVTVIFFGVKTFSAILFAGGFILFKVFFMKTLPSNYFMFLSILLALIGFYLPGLWLRIKIARRKDKILKGFPDALDMMVVCVEAGMGLDAAINRIGEEMKLGNKELSEEFKIVSLELRTGKSRRDALKNLALRTDLEDIKSLVTLLIQTDKFGTSIAQSLRVYSDSMRTKRYQRAEEIAAKLPLKMLFPLILFIFPSLFVAILGPAAIQIYRQFLTH
jgi:tight adherence protein C